MASITTHWLNRSIKNVASAWHILCGEYGDTGGCVGFFVGKRELILGDWPATAYGDGRGSEVAGQGGLSGKYVY